MLTVLSLNDVLTEAEALAEKREFATLVRFLEGDAAESVQLELTCRFLLAYGRYMCGDEVGAVDLVASNVAENARRPNDRLSRRIRNLHAIIEVERGNLDGASALLADLLEASHRANDQRFLGYATLNQAIVLQMRGASDAAILSFRRASTAFQHIGEQAAVAGCAHNLGMAFRDLGRFDEADSAFLSAWEYFDSNGSAEERVTTEIERAALTARRGSIAAAERAAAHALAAAAALGNERLQGEGLRVLGGVQRQLGRTVAARRTLARALAIARDLSVPLLEAEVLTELARIDATAGSTRSAMTALRSAMALHAGMGAFHRVQALQWEFPGLLGDADPGS